MPDAAAVRTEPANPPIDYVVAAWLGMPAAEIAQGLREGWIRAPQGVPPGWQPVTATGFPAPLPPSRDGIGPRLSNDQAVADAEIDRARVYAMLRRLDRSLDAATFDAAWNEAGADDAARAHSLAGFVARALGVAAAAGSASVLDIDAALARASGTARFERLAGLSGSELARRAAGDAGVRAALAGHSRWALTGDRELAGRGDPQGRYDRFDRDTGEALLSDAWLGDRARFAAWRMAADDGTPLAVDGDGWRFVDRAAGDAMTVEIEGAQDARHQVIFARDGGDRVNGDATTDRIHGGAGDDLLRGRAGDDLLEGGGGSDMLQGGSGRDDLAGQQGDDEIDGGAGDDRLDGGSGNDDLTGGRGDDLLRGGAGDDSYRFAAGDGSDIVADDGGRLYFDDVELAGSMRREGTGWVSADGRVGVSLEGTLTDGGTLAIRALGEGGDVQGGVIRVLDWQQGRFGLTLEGIDNQIHGVEATSSDPEAASIGGPAPDSSGAADSGDPSEGPGAGGDESGDPGSPGGASGGEASADAAPVLTPSDLALVAPDPLAQLRLVDATAVASAFEHWSTPAPPDVPFANAIDASLLTRDDVAGALADAGSFDDGDASGVTVDLASRFASGLPGLREPDPPAPLPELTLRRTH